MSQLTDDQLANVAHDFYISKLNIAEISSKYQLSRYLIGKALDEAQERGIVQISIKNGSFKREPELERKIQDKYHLKDVFILHKMETKIEDDEALTTYTAKRLQNVLTTNHVIGFTWGTTLLDIVNNLHGTERPDLYFVQLLGWPVNASMRKNPLEQRLADKFDANSISLPLPLYGQNIEFCQNARKEPFYKLADKYYQRLDLIVSGVGTLEALDDDRFLKKFYKENLFSAYYDQIAGFIFGRPYDIHGELFSSIQPHICGITDKELRQVPTRLVVEKNRFKSKALAGALRTGLVTHLITNDGIAERLLQY